MLREQVRALSLSLSRTIRTRRYANAAMDEEVGKTWSRSALGRHRPSAATLGPARKPVRLERRICSSVRSAKRTESGRTSVVECRLAPRGCHDALLSFKRSKRENKRESEAK